MNAAAAFARACIRKKRQDERVLNVFLRRAGERLRRRSARGDIVHVVLGNQASDADSVVSAIALAFVRDRSSSSRDVFVPLVAASRNDFENIHPLEPFLLHPYVSMDRLIYLEEVISHLERLHATKNLRIILTDHNKLAPHLHAKFADAVVEIYDHHADQNCYLVQVPSKRRQIAFDAEVGSGWGSCCTLIASLPESKRVLAREGTDTGLARLLLDVILVDTIGLSEKAGKTKPADVTAVKSLRSLLSESDGLVLSHRFHEIQLLNSIRRSGQSDRWISVCVTTSKSMTFADCVTARAAFRSASRNFGKERLAGGPGAQSSRLD